jgi:exopolysaccharide biosynthesis protein
MTLVSLARLMRRGGASSALNVDGGGSSTMVVQGEIVNRPSLGYPRAVPSVFLVLRAASAP